MKRLTKAPRECDNEMQFHRANKKRKKKKRKKLFIAGLDKLRHIKPLYSNDIMRAISCILIHTCAEYIFFCSFNKHTG